MHPCTHSPTHAPTHAWPSLPVNQHQDLTPPSMQTLRFDTAADFQSIVSFIVAKLEIHRDFSIRSYVNLRLVSQMGGLWTIEEWFLVYLDAPSIGKNNIIKEMGTLLALFKLPIVRQPCLGIGCHCLFCVHTISMPFQPPIYLTK